ncbi:MAG TPA: phosphotransferase [Pseudomonadales bacterium]|nr:phosphotransferase [Pseudomonadales bacterium]
MTASPEQGRWAELVLVDGSGTVIGKLPPLHVEVPWWPEVETLVRAVRERFGVDVTILRLLSSPPSGMRGGHVKYLAEVSSRVDCTPCDDVLDEQPLRNAYAKVGGPAADLTWARSVLARHGYEPTAPPVQIKTWNLSSLWRIPLEHGADAWLKAVPKFFAHEGALIDALGPHAPVPRLFGYESGRLVMRYIPGDDLWRATHTQRIAMLDALVGLQHAWVSNVSALSALGVADWRAATLVRAIERTFERTRSQLSAAAARTLEVFIARLDERFLALAACGIPESLVHGDYHPGNVRGTGTDLTILDWGDAGVGHPLLDMPAFMERAPAEMAASLRDHWITLWRARCPGSDPARAWELIEPIAAARRATVYLGFLDRIEPAEHPYHGIDPRDHLQITAEIVDAE